MIVLISVPFLGHYTAIKRIAASLDKPFLIVLLSWKDFPFVKEKSRILSGNTVVIETEFALEATDPTEFNWKRAFFLTEKLHAKLASSPDIIDLIVYDFFCIEAHIVGRQMRLPTVCCIPAIPFQFFGVPSNPWMYQVYQLYLSGGTIAGQRAFVSDFLMINDPDEEKWLTCSPSLQPNIAYLKKTTFVDLSTRQKRKEHIQYDIYVCLGTVVTGNLFSNACNQFKEELVSLYEEICKFSRQTDSKTLICIPGPVAFRYVSNILADKYPEIRFENNVDQVDVLQNSSVFITHGGGNSITEAIDCNVPMFCVPFFGDQWASAMYINKQKFGVAFTVSDSLSVGTTQNAIDDQDLFKKKVKFVSEELPAFFAERIQYSNNIWRAKQENTAENVKDALGKQLSKPIMKWKDGDLLFGASKDREMFCATELGVGVDFQFGKHFVASSTQKYPTLIDHYNDVYYENQPLRFDSALLDAYKKWQPEELTGKRIATMTKEQVGDSCCAGIRFFLNEPNFAGNVIHFIVGPDFINNQSSVAHRELDCLKTFDRVVLYCFNVNRDRQLFRVTMPQIAYLVEKESLGNRLQAHNALLANLKGHLQAILTENATVFGGAVLEFRIKSAESLIRNFAKNRFSTNDVIGFRIIHPFTEALFEIASLIEKNLQVLSKRVSERGKVIHMILLFEESHCELQLWPSVLHSCFMAEHATVYKATTPLNTEALKNSHRIREQEHDLQNIIDGYGRIVK